MDEAKLTEVNPKNVQRRKLLRETALVDLVDVEVLQKVLSWFSRTTGISAVVRDLDGRLVTKPTYQNPFCALVMGSQSGPLLCGASNRKAVALAEREHRAVKYVCDAGLTQIAAPIEVDGVCVGTIVMGDRPEGTVDPKQIASLSGQIALPEDQLMSARKKVKHWSDEEMEPGVNFLLSITNAVSELCYQGVSLRARLQEIRSLYEMSKLLTGTLDLQEVLNRVARSATEVFGAKGCSIRLLDSRRKKLVVKSFYNLSQHYLDKGPVLLAKSPIDKEALRGKVVQMFDMVSDPRVLYPKEAEREGIRSGVSIGLISKRRSIGTLHLYSSEPRAYDESDIQVLRSLANQAAVAIENAQLYQQSLEKRRMDRELRVAGTIQEQLLPERAPQIEGFDIAAASVPCSQVGGDFYDFIPLRDQRTVLVIADVAGKGVPGALLMASARAGLRAHLESVTEPHEVVRRLNLNLCHDARSGQFVSLFCAVLDEERRILSYTNAGHNPPLVVRGGELLRLEEGGLVLGADDEETYEEGSLSLQPGDVVVFYTDGVTEALNAEDEIFGTVRLLEVVRGWAGTDAETIISRIRRSIREFTRATPQSDDITLVVLRVANGESD